jgi:16S rRNA (guanine(1405)-N(7))-methyltransferase
MKPFEIEALIQKITRSKKYRLMEIPHETLQDLLTQEMERHGKEADAIQSVKGKLHNIMAPYLGDLDYPEANKALEAALASEDKEQIAGLCTLFLKGHHSTAERLPYAKSFYEYIFAQLGETCSVLDLACGLNPFFLALIEPPPTLTYTAYDIHAPRIGLIEQLFAGDIGVHGKVETRDILVRPPQEQVNAVFLFKEAHRMEKRRSGATRELITALNATHIFISLPNHSLNGRFDLSKRMNRLIETSIEGLNLHLSVKEFQSETLYHLEHTHGKA